jgi:hypothetical protein
MWHTLIASFANGSHLLSEKDTTPAYTYVHTLHMWPYGMGSSTHKKTPTWNSRGQPHTLPPLSLERTSQRYVGQVSWLAACPYSLHLPKVKSLSGLCRFRSAYSCGAAMGLHHLPWTQSETVSNPTSVICDFVLAYGSVSRVVKDIYGGSAVVERAWATYARENGRLYRRRFPSCQGRHRKLERRRRQQD